MQFYANISSRSSSQKGGPTGESEIIAINPKRRERILQCTRWNNLVDGTLNLEVENHIVKKLLNQKPIMREPGNEVRYPPPYERIPFKRQAYIYFKGTIAYNSMTVAVLFRTAENPLPNRLEAFASVHLKTKLTLSDGDKVFCIVEL